MAWTRTEQANPYSGKIVSGPHFENHAYVGDHGKAVWDAVAIGMIGGALRGKPFLTPPPAPPVEKRLVSVTITFTDGTTATYSA